MAKIPPADSDDPSVIDEAATSAEAVAADAVEPLPTTIDVSVETSDLRKLEEDRDRYYDLLLRKTAEFENYRKRIERERREQSEQATADLLLELVGIVDDFERALKVEPGGDQGESYRRGVEIIHAKLVDLLKRRGVRPLESMGVDFDPHLHQAVAHEESADHRRGEIVEEYRRGYMLGDRLLRAALVKVANA